MMNQTNELLIASSPVCNGFPRFTRDCLEFCLLFCRWETVGCARGCHDVQQITLDDRISIDDNGE